MSIEGYAEPLADGKITGWIWNPADPGRALQVEAFNGSTFYRRTVADLFRDDLLRAGKRAGYCSFEIPAPANLEGELHIVLDGTPHRLLDPSSSETGLVLDWLDGDGLFLRPTLLVHRLTSGVLGRPATRLELLKSSTQTGDVHALTRLARTIMASAPDLAAERSEEYLVDQVYLGVLTRLADARGITIYSEALRSGMSLSDLIQELIRTPEFARAHQPAAVQTGGGADVSADIREVTRAMKATLATLMLHRTGGDGSLKR